MKTIRQLLENKGHEIVSATSDTSVYEALEIMAEHNVGALLVQDAGELVGIFSERDYARKVVLKGKSSRGTSLGETMSRKVACVRADQTIEECMALMTEKSIRHLPVMEGDRLAGIISIGDLVNACRILVEQENSELRQYIQGPG